jgi:hypothetical protein
MNVDFSMKVKLHRTWTLDVLREGEISCILHPHIGQSVWSATHSGSLAVYRPTFYDKSVKLHHENISKFKGRWNFSNSMIWQYPTKSTKPMKVSTKNFLCKFLLETRDVTYYLERFSGLSVYMCITYFDVNLVSHAKCLCYYILDTGVIQIFTQMLLNVSHVFVTWRAALTYCTWVSLGPCHG